MQASQDPFMGEDGPRSIRQHVGHPPRVGKTQHCWAKWLTTASDEPNCSKRVKTQTHVLAHLIRIQRQSCDRIIDQSEGQRNRHCLLGWRVFLIASRLVQPMKLRPPTWCCEAKQKSIVMGPWIIDGVIINDERIRGTRFPRALQSCTKRARRDNPS